MATPSDLPSSFRLDGLVAVVIGGTGSLGGRVAEALAEAGAGTVVVGRDAERGAAVAEEMAARGLDVGFEPADATVRADLRDLVGRVLRSHGRVDVLVNGAGASSGTPFLEIDDDELDRVIALNQLSVVRGCQEFGRYFVGRAQASGVGASIVNVGSVSGLTPLSRQFTYSMAKAAVHNLTRNLAREWGPLGIRCNVLVPGFFPAEQNRAIMTPERTRAVLSHTPLARLGEPDELKGAVLLLASEAGRFVTGSELVVDGGFGATAI